MKKILITGAGSYIGTAFERYLGKYGEYEIKTVDMTDASWKTEDFSGYDTVFHVAGIAHSDSGKITPEKERLYYEVNTCLTFETAKKAKAEGVRQFIFMSSAIVYGDSAPIGKSKRITRDTQPAPANSYGDSKLQAEKKLLTLDCDSFKTVILRPPMIYGKGSRGNYPVLAKLAVRLPIFPYVKNERSMLYIDNLCEFVRLAVENGERGIFMPQNSEYSDTSELVKMIAAAHGKKVHTVRGLTPVLKLMSRFTGLVNKAFGSLSYDKEISRYKTEYALVGLEESVRRTESDETAE